MVTHPGPLLPIKKGGVLSDIIYHLSTALLFRGGGVVVDLAKRKSILKYGISGLILALVSIFISSYKEGKKKPS